ncbi:unnamed protein product [Ostreobium quekettii]|uniref:SBP-type domain-containing protein n=1 Tax=Ostreobium quekettii TaxID=121088 RepID=A0A8S1J3A5_9CHLO|nr:unnamed protein product [Ostreobium quekettii]|eukprot:evm.model.scf_851.5 EVM.evm.TU.scf_851.5   scf_851:42104-49905(+)
MANVLATQMAVSSEEMDKMPPCSSFAGCVGPSDCDYGCRMPSLPQMSFPHQGPSQTSRQDQHHQFAGGASGFAMPGVVSSPAERPMQVQQLAGRGYEPPMGTGEPRNVSHLAALGNGGMASCTAPAMQACSFQGLGNMFGSGGTHQPSRQVDIFGSVHSSRAAGMESSSGVEAGKAIEGTSNTIAEPSATTFPADVPVLVSDTGNMQLVCQVPGCGKELDNLKEYHQRYRICDIHIKLPQVVKSGRLQRFCQQCGRFHDLSAFDGNRRSCRDQLNKHNARRRKRACQRLRPEMADVENFAGDDSEVGRFLQGLLKSPGHLRTLRLLLGLPSNNALPPQNPMPAPYTSRANGALGRCSESCQCNMGTSDPATEDHSDGALDSQIGTVGGPTQPSAEDASPRDKTTYNLARKMVNCKGDFSSSFESDERLHRLSIKLFNKTPSSLPPGLKGDILSWLGSAPTVMEGMIAPGCVLLTVHMLLASQIAEKIAMAGVQGVVAHLLQQERSKIWRTSTMVVQLGQHTAVVDGGQIHSTLNIGNRNRTPGIRNLYPVCVSPSSDRVVTLETRALCCNECQVYCRTPESPLRINTWRCEGTPEMFKCHFGPTSGTCLAFVELGCGAVLSEPRVLLSVEDDDVAKEINSLATNKEAAARFGGKMDEFLMDVALVFQNTNGKCRHHISIKQLGKKARRLLGFACDHGCIALAERLFTAATWGCASVDEAIQDSMSTTGLSLLHRAVRSGSTTLTNRLMEWAWANSAELCGCGKGRYGITPLHLSALLEDDGHMVVTLLSCCGPQIFTTAMSDDGVTPFHLALQMGHFQVDKLIVFLQSLRKKRCLNSAWHDACETCDSPLPPLLLSIMASCGLCGAQKLPAPHSAHAICSASTPKDKGTTNVMARDRTCSSEMALSAVPIAPKLEPCDHEDNVVYSITAMCQTCHTDRVLVVF